jgi:phenylacetate-CoA ligase
MQPNGASVVSRESQRLKASADGGPIPTHADAAAHAAHAAPAGAYAKLYARVLWPAWERIIKRRDTVDHLAFLESTQWLSEEKIAEYQATQLRALLEHAGEHVPYYRDLFRTLHFDPRGVTSRSDIEQLPILTREIVRERYADLLDPASVGKNIKKGTSGSTGTPLKFEYSQESECWRQAMRIRGYEWGGYTPGCPVFYYWAVVAAPPPGPRGLKIKLDRAMKRETFFDSMRQDEASRRQALAILRRTKPKVIVCYTQSCAQFARWILDNGLRDWDDIPVLCGAEAVLPADRAVLSKAFGPDVFETYGSRETMLMASECEAHDGMHLSEENLLLEVVQNGRGVAPGVAGDVVVTDLHNYSMPFIRYANGDVASMADPKPCSCGRGLRKLARVDGRRADTLLDKDGNPVPGIVFHVLFSDARKEVIKQFQAVQKPTGEVILRVVRGQDWSESEFDAIVSRFAGYLRGLPFSVELVDLIAPSSTGKMKTIIVERA